MRVVFTGPAFDKNGQSIVRANLIEACLEKGTIDVQNRVDATTDMLVASRKDTVKAKGAEARGLAVFTYPEFIDKFLRGVDIVGTGKPNKFVDKTDLVEWDKQPTLFPAHVDAL